MSKIFEFNSVDELKDKVEGKDLYMSIEVYTQIKKAFYSKVKRKKVNKWLYFGAGVVGGVFAIKQLQK